MFASQAPVLALGSLVHAGPGAARAVLSMGVPRESERDSR
jgi:hypothetical protein